MRHSFILGDYTFIRSVSVFPLLSTPFRSSFMRGTLEHVKDSNGYSCLLVWKRSDELPPFVMFLHWFLNGMGQMVYFRPVPLRRVA